MIQATKALTWVVGFCSILPSTAIAQNAPTPATVQVGETTYQVVDRIVIRRALVLRKPQAHQLPPCARRRVSDPTSCVIGGAESYGILGCMSTANLPEEPVDKTLARLPGRDAPNLFVEIMEVYLTKKRTSGTLRVAVTACGPRVAIPIAEKDEVNAESRGSFNRLLLSFSTGHKLAHLALLGIAAKPETYRVAGMNQAVLFDVPFKSAAGMSIEESRDGETTRSIQVSGAFEVSSYAGAKMSYKKASREVVPGHNPVPVKVE